MTHDFNREERSEFEPDDPAGTARQDQSRAEAMDHLRTSKTFITVTMQGEADAALMISVAPGTDVDNLLHVMSRAMWEMIFRQTIEGAPPAEVVMSASQAFATDGIQYAQELM